VISAVSDGVAGIRGIREDEESSESDYLPEDLHALVLKLTDEIGDAGQVAPGTGHALHEAGGDGIAHVDEDHRDLRRGRLRRADGLVLEGDDQVHPLAHEGPCGLACGVFVGLVSVVEADALAVLIAQTLEALAQGREPGWIVVETHVEEADVPHARRLRLSNEGRHE